MSGGHICLPFIPGIACHDEEAGIPGPDRILRKTFSFYVIKGPQNVPASADTYVVVCLEGSAGNKKIVIIGFSVLDHVWAFYCRAEPGGPSTDAGFDTFFGCKACFGIQSEHVRAAPEGAVKHVHVAGPDIRDDVCIDPVDGQGIRSLQTTAFGIKGPDA